LKFVNFKKAVVIKFFCYFRWHVSTTAWRTEPAQWWVKICSKIGSVFRV